MRSRVSRCIARLMFFSGLLALLFGGSNAEAVGITLDSTGPAEFSVFAIQMDGITAMEIQIVYDVGTLKSPRVSPTGILLARAKVTADTASEGSVRFNVVTNDEPLLGSGMIATLEFDQVTEDWPGRIISASVLVTEEDGGTVSVPVVITNPPQQRISPPKEEDGQTPSGGPPGTTSDESSGASAQNTSPSAPPPEKGRTTGEATRPESPGSFPNNGTTPRSGEGVKGVFARFAVLPEDQLLDGLRRLIATGIGDSFAQVVQDPPLVLSDGLSTITLTVRLAENDGNAPIFILNGVRNVSLKNLDSGWTLNLLPIPGARDISVTVLHNNVAREYPLTVAPPIDAYMENRRTAVPWNRFDSFVELANYLVRSGGGSFSSPSLGSLPTGTP